MPTKKNILSLFAILVLGISPFAATVPAYAAINTTNTQTNFFTGLVQYIAQTFHLDQTQVQNAVNTYKTQQKTAMQQNRQNQYKKYLDGLVSSGKITSSQEEQILDEQSKLQSEYNPATLKNMTAQQRKAQFQQEQNEIKSWAQSTGIRATYLRFGGMGMRGHGGFGRWGHASATPTPTPGS